MLEENENDFISQQESELYSVANPAPKLEQHPLKGTSFKMRSSFKIGQSQEKDKTKKRSSLAKRFFVISLFVLIFAVLYTSYRLFFSESREDFIAKHIDVVLENPPFTKGGESLPLTFTVYNRNSVDLKNINIEISYPRGSEAEVYEDFERVRFPLPDIVSGSKVSKTVPVILYGEQGSTKNIKATIEYTLPDSSLVYNKQSESALTISSSPIILEVDSPPDISPGQLYTFRLRITQNTQNLPTGALVSIISPRDFTIESFSKTPNFGTGIWKIGTLKEGDYEDITVSGRFSSQEGDERSFKIIAGVPENESGTNIKTSYVSKTQIVSLTRPILDAYLLLGTEKGKIISVDPNTYIQGELVYRNSSNIAVIDPVFKINIAGSALDEFSIIPTDGFYNSNNKEMFWDKNTLPDLFVIKPKSEGKLSFTFRVLPKYTEEVNVVKDPSVKLSLSFSGIKDDGLGIVQNLENIENAVVRVATEPKINIVNNYAKGALPPKVGESSLYQINFSVSNTNNDITGAKLVAKIPFYVDWVGKVTGNEKITYNPDTREVIWNVGTLVSGSGYTSKIRSASIQLSITPSLSQIDAIPEILQNIRFVGTDVFSNKDVKASHNNVTTRIDNGSSTDAVIVR